MMIYSILVEHKHYLYVFELFNHTPNYLFI